MLLLRMFLLLFLRIEGLRAFSLFFKNSCCVSGMIPPNLTSLRVFFESFDSCLLSSVLIESLSLSSPESLGFGGGECVLIDSLTGYLAALGWLIWLGWLALTMLFCWFLLRSWG